jgi:hypothetical protein
MMVCEREFHAKVAKKRRTRKCLRKVRETECRVRGFSQENDYESRYGDLHAGRRLLNSYKEFAFFASSRPSREISMLEQAVIGNLVPTLLFEITSRFSIRVMVGL